MGGLLAFRVDNYNNTAEREQFRFLCEQLKAHYENSGEFCVFVGNYNIGCELDGLFIKKDAIIVIEFKNYGGMIVANENGAWTCDGKNIKGGSRKTVLQQARINHSTVKKELKELGVSKENIKDIPTLIIFNQPIQITNNLSGTNKSWLHITDNQHFLEKLDDITCPKTDLTPLDIVNFAEKLNLNPFFLAEFSNANYDQYTQNVKKYQYEGDNKLRQFVQDKKIITGNIPDFENYIIDDKDSISLIEHVQQIIKLSLKLDAFTIKVLDGLKFSRTFAQYGKTICHKYVVMVIADRISDYCTKLSKFTNHEIGVISPSIIFWEEGEERDDEEKETTKKTEVRHEENSINTDKSIIFRKSRTILPHWLDNIIFNKHHAIYAPEYKRYEYNLDLTSEELKVYLGTYFPRSYAEMYCIADNLLQNKNILSKIKQGNINILDFGCGTGGEILGLVTAIGKHFPFTKINITAVDGNKEALLILKDIIEKIPNNNLKVELSTVCQMLSCKNDLDALNNGRNEYQFVLCDKMICELISKDILPSNAYAIMTKTLSSHLHENGLLIILDVTTKDGQTGLFYPLLMNHSINDFVYKSNDIETLLPLSCASYHHCTDYCFMQQTFSISHSHKSNDESRVCYRVLCRKKLKIDVLQDNCPHGVAHIIHPIKYKQKDATAICNQTQNNEIVIDTFNINL